MVGLDEAADRLAAVRGDRLAVQFGGPAGTRAGLGGAGPADRRDARRRAGPRRAGRCPGTPTARRVAELAGALGAAAGAAGKIARDIVLLAQDEVAEVAEGTPGGSSAMAHKHNPVAR